MIPAAVGFQCPECVRAGNRGVRRPVTRFGGATVSGAPVTLTLAVVNVAVFVVTSLQGGAGNLLGGGSGALFDDFALIPPAVAHGEWWRLFTSAFLHFGLLHIFFNMSALLLIGPAVEAALGRWRYLALYLFSGVGGSLLTVAVASPFTNAAGASGAIFGLFGALYVLQRRIGQREGSILPTIVINLVLSFTIRNISWEGHVGGLIVGTLFTLALVASAGGAPRRLLRHGAVAAVAAVVLAALGVVAVNHERSVCGSSQNPDVAYECLHYDPPSVAGNAGAAPGVVLSSNLSPAPGGHHA